MSKLKIKPSEDDNMVKNRCRSKYLHLSVPRQIKTLKARNA